MQSEPGIQTLRATTHPLFDLAPGGACHDGRDHSRSRQALTLPFHPYPVKPGGLLSVALSFLQICFAVSAIRRTPCSMESGLSSGVIADPGGRRRRFQYLIYDKKTFFPVKKRFFSFSRQKTACKSVICIGHFFFFCSAKGFFYEKRGKLPFINLHSHRIGIRLYIYKNKPVVPEKKKRFKINNKERNKYVC